MAACSTLVSFTCSILQSTNCCWLRGLSTWRYVCNIGGYSRCPVKDEQTHLRTPSGTTNFSYLEGSLAPIEAGRLPLPAAHNFLCQAEPPLSMLAALPGFAHTGSRADLLGRSELPNVQAHHILVDRRIFRKVLIACTAPRRGEATIALNPSLIKQKTLLQHLSTTKPRARTAARF